MKKGLQLLFVAGILFCFSNTLGQMRQVYVNNAQPDNEIYQISFYSPAQGFLTFRDWIGYTKDTRRTSTFKLIYQSPDNLFQLSTGITDMIFSENNSIGYAVDADCIFKITDPGVTWSVIKTYPDSFFDHLEAADNTNVIAMSTDYTTNKLLTQVVKFLFYQLASKLSKRQ